MDDELLWISRTLATTVVRTPTIQVLWRGYGELYRIQLGEGRSTAIVKSVRPPPHPEGDHAHRRKCRSYDVELAWYRRWAPSCAVRIPRLLAAESRDERWLFVLEDLDAAGYAGRTRSPNDQQIDQCLEWLAGFHAHHLGVEPTGLWERGTYWDLEKRPDELRALKDAGLRSSAPVLDARLRECEFQTLVHGDAKLANFCFGRAGVAAVDFQWTGRGVGVCDVAYFLDRQDDARWLDRYFRHLRHALSGRAVDVDAVERSWRALYPTAVADFQRFYAGWA